MLPAPVALDEPQRLAALRQLHVLDTPPEPRYDVLVECAARALGVPVALISLVDADRQWFKACVGLDVRQTARDISFCGHAIHRDDTLVVKDARCDARFADNPLVTGAPHIRFYAGAPLKSPQGHAVGAFCVIDLRPRRLDAAQLQLLLALRNLAACELWVAEYSAALQGYLGVRSRLLLPPAAAQ